MAAQGTVSYPGVNQPSGAEFTLSQGINPSVCLLTMAPQSNFVAQVGPLVFQYGGTVIRFADCFARRGSLDASRGGQFMRLEILDRRWKWQFGSISQNFNVRLQDGEIDADTKTPAQSIASKLLDEMGEGGYDVGQIPGGTFPEMLLDNANPAQALDDLCTRLHCRVVLGLNNRVKIVQNGQGRNLPIIGREIALAGNIEAAVKPDKIKLVCAPVLYQSKFKLEAVGLETDGRILPIDKLSYKPAAGWDAEDPFVFAGVSGTYKQDGKQLNKQDLALESVYRWYRVKELAEGGLTPKGVTPEVKDVSQFILLDYRVERSDEDKTYTKRKPVIVQGQHILNSDGRENVSAEWDVYPEDFSFEPPTQIVRFSEPIYMHKAGDEPADPGTPSEYKAADMYLTAAYNLRTTKSGPVHRYTPSKDVGGRKLGTKELVIRRDDIQARVIHEYNGVKEIKKRTVNRDAVQAEADHYLKAAIRDLVPEAGGDGLYEGLVPIEPDGAIQQVSWRVGDGQAAVTRASRNQEHDPFVPSFKQQQQINKMGKLILLEQEINRALDVARFVGA